MRQLPSTSRLQTKLRDTVEFEEPEPGAPERFGPWGTEHYQLASVIDALHGLQLTLIQVNSEKGAKVPEIAPVPRPATKTRKKPDQISDAALAYLQAIRDRHAQESATPTQQ